MTKRVRDGALADPVMERLGAKPGPVAIGTGHIGAVPRDEDANVHLVVMYSDPRDEDEIGIDYTEKGRVSVELFKRLLSSNNYDYYSTLSKNFDFSSWFRFKTGRKHVKNAARTVAEKSGNDPRAIPRKCFFLRGQCKFLKRLIFLREI